MRVRVLPGVIAAAIILSVFVLLLLGFCEPFGDDDGDDDGTAVVQTDEDEDEQGADVVGHVGSQRGVEDCDAEDRRRHEADCGFYILKGNRQIFTEYTWVKVGRTTPPAGWNRTAEMAAAAGAAPRATKTVPGTPTARTPAATVRPTAKPTVTTRATTVRRR